MITETILGILFLPIRMLLTLVPNFSDTISIPVGVFNGINALLGNLGYIIPVVQLIPIFGLSIALHSFHFIWVLILRIKSFIPTMGN